MKQLAEALRNFALATRPGRWLTGLAAIGLLWLHEVSPWLLAGALLCLVWPERRRLLLSLLTLAFVLVAIGGQPGSPAWPGGWLWAAALLLTCWLLYRWALALPKHAGPLGSRPLITLHAATWLLLLSWPWLGGRSSDTALLATVPLLIWPASYLLLAGRRGGATGTGLTDHLFYLLPMHLWGLATNAAKGHDYLARHEAKTTAALARARLGAVKLLLLALAWQQLSQLLETGVHDGNFYYASRILGAHSLGWPRLGDLIATPTAAPLWQLWLTLLLELVEFVLKLAAWGHVIIAYLRFAGFNVFRITYKPLLAESLLDFWGRLSYYFKEICVDFFFYPVFLRCQRLRPRLRLFLAVFAAAFLGNMYWHLLSRPELITTHHLAGLWQTWSARLVYCLILATGIWVSMLRQQRQRAAATDAHWLRRLRRIAGVWLFYGLLHVWNVTLPDGQADVAARWAFQLALFGWPAGN